MKDSERLRFATVGVGLAGWIAYPFAMWAGISARHAARCAGRSFDGRMDDCFNDYLPIAEVGWCIVAWLLSWFFLRFALALWAPGRSRQSVDWPRDSAPEDHWPVLHGLAALGAAWTIWNFLSVPMQGGNWLLLAYWAMFALWFVGAVFTGWRSVRRDGIT